MDTPKIAEKKCQKVELEAEKTYFFCSCGLSTKQPYCDGSHKDTGFTPIPYKPETDESKWACNCKQSAIMPFCDGTHKTL